MMTICLQTIRSIREAAVIARRNPPNPSKYAATIADAIKDARKDSLGSGRVTVKRHLRTLLNKSGWQKRSPQNIAAISAALIDSEVFPDHDITDPTIPLDNWIRFSDEPFPDRDPSRIFIKETALNRFIRTYHESVFSGVEGLTDLELVAHEKKVHFGGQTRRVDLLFRDPTDGTYVVVELERGDPKGNSALQVRQYMDAVASGDKSVRGVLITARPRSAQLEEDILRELDEM